LLLFVDSVETKHIIAPVLHTLVGDPKKVFEAFHGQILEALRALVKRAIKSGDIRKDLTRSICFALSSALPTSPPAPSGRTAHADWWRFLSLVRGC
jgi:hypothetical protein